MSNAIYLTCSQHINLVNTYQGACKKCIFLGKKIEIENLKYGFHPQIWTTLMKKNKV